MTNRLCHVTNLSGPQELIEVNSGAFNDRLRKAVKIGKKHVRQCLLCSQKGFICETCHSSSVIYPFDMIEGHISGIMFAVGVCCHSLLKIGSS